MQKVWEDSMKRMIDQILEYHTRVPMANIAGPMTMDEMGADSLDCIEICMDIEDKISIQISDLEISSIKTVQDIYDLVDEKQREKPSNQPPAPKTDEAITEQKETTLGEN